MLYNRLHSKPLIIFFSYCDLKLKKYTWNLWRFYRGQWLYFLLYSVIFSSLSCRWKKQSVLHVLIWFHSQVKSLDEKFLHSKGLQTFKQVRKNLYFCFKKWRTVWSWVKVISYIKVRYHEISHRNNSHSMFSDRNVFSLTVHVNEAVRLSWRPYRTTGHIFAILAYELSRCEMSFCEITWILKVLACLFLLLSLSVYISLFYSFLLSFSFRFLPLFLFRSREQKVRWANDEEED